VVFQILKCTLNPIVSPRRILPGEVNDDIHDDLSDAWPTGIPFVAGIKLLRDKFTVPARDRVRGENGREFPQSLAADGMRLHREQSLLSELFEQCFDLTVLELNDLLLTLVHEAVEGSQQGVPC